MAESLSRFSEMFPKAFDNAFLLVLFFFSYRCGGATFGIINHLTGILTMQNWLTYGEPFKTNYSSATPRLSVLRGVVFHLLPTY